MGAQPITLPEAKWELADTDIYTFVTDHQLPFIVEGYVAASVGTACTGLFNPKKLRHCLWNSEHIVKVLRQQCHNQWPYVEFKEAYVKARECGESNNLAPTNPIFLGQGHHYTDE